MGIERNITNILVDDKENKGITCPYCGEKINIDISDILNKLSKNNDKVRNILNGIQAQIKNIINSNNNKIDSILSQLNTITYTIDNINEDMEKNKEEIIKIDKIFNNINNIELNEKEGIDIFEGIEEIEGIEGIIDIENEDINKYIQLYNSKEDIEIYINNERIINENKYKFDKQGKYKFKLTFF